MPALTAESAHSASRTKAFAARFTRAHFVIMEATFLDVVNQQVSGFPKMTKIDPLSSLVAIVSAQPSAARDVHANSQRRSSAESHGSVLPVDGDHALRAEERLLQCIRTIRPDEEDRPEKAFRMFLESALAEVFGTRIQADKDLAHLVDKVLDYMHEDSDLREASAAAAEVLLARADDAPQLGSDETGQDFR
jgi:hypothetical protein